jgi:hypothetical protein
MAAFETPTINDFLGQLHMQIERAVGDFQKSKSKIDSMCAKAGTLQSSRRVLLVLDAIDENVEKGVAMLLAELRRALCEPELDASELRNLIRPRLDELASRTISAAALDRIPQSLKSGQFHELIAARVAEVRHNVQFWLRQFDIGWDEPVKPETLKPPLDSR